MLSVHQLSKSFGHRAVLRGLDFTVDSGGITLLVGANGAGKTTALRIVAGLADPDAGGVSIAGYKLDSERGRALAHLSFLPQAPRFHPRLTARQVVDFYARLRGRPGSIVPAALDAWGLNECSDVATGRLSGGLRQRLALAVFAIADAPVLVLDEPGLSLDPEWRERLQEYLDREARRGRTVLIATHLLGEWEGRANRCLVIREGRCAGEIAPDDLRDGYFGASGGRPDRPLAGKVHRILDEMPLVA